MLSGMSPGGGDSVATAPALAAGADGEAFGAGPVLGLLLQPAAHTPAAARTRTRRVTATALTLSMPGRYKEPGERRRCAR